MTTTITTNKPFHIDKKRVYEAYKAVKSNHGAAGVDGQTPQKATCPLLKLSRHRGRSGCVQEKHHQLIQVGRSTAEHLHGHVRAVANH
jgi:hypothetical protein